MDKKEGFKRLRPKAERKWNMRSSLAWLQRNLRSSCVNRLLSAVCTVLKPGGKC